ncbi:MAG: hypothetical protein ACT4O2_07995 [Beijerinckiaceae bacterium]
MNTALLSGLPRSGTTLVCACLNELPDCIALAEPMSPSTHGNVDLLLDEIDAFVASARTRALAEGKACSKTVGKVVAPDNWFEKPTLDGRLRAPLASLKDIDIGKPLSPGFGLFIKHPSLFTAVSGRLQERYPLYAIVRHPLDVLASWQTVDIPCHQGRIPVGECFAPDLKRRLDAIASPRERQLTLLRWFFDIYGAFPRDRVIRYEDLIADPAAALARLHAKHAPINIVIWAERPETRYPGVDLASLARDLLALSPAIETFYPNFAESLDQHLSSRRESGPRAEGQP